MKKQKQSQFFIVLLGIIFSFNSSVAQYIYPDYYLPTGLHNSTLEDFRVPGNIYIFGATFINNENGNYSAGKSIEINPGTEIIPSPYMGSFEDFNLITSNCDVAILNISSQPNTNTNLYGHPIHELLEIGVKLPTAVNDAINNFFDNSNPIGSKINPYNFTWDPSEPGYINVKATFTGPSGQQRIVDGFFYRDFEATRVTTTNTWAPRNNDYPFRIRFAPDQLGDWSVSIEILSSIQNIYSLTIDPNCSNLLSNGKFLCAGYGEGYDYSSDGYLENGSHNFLRYHDSQKSFFAIGVNTSWPTSMQRPRPTDVAEYNAWFTNLHANGANTAGFHLTKFAGEIEWENLGNYESRQNDAYFIDRVFELARANNIYLKFSCMIHYTGSEWTACPYNQISGVNQPLDFFTNSKAMAMFQRKLRYIVARWGYSTNILNYNIFDELNTFIKSNAYSWGSTEETLVRAWVNTMAIYLQSLLATRENKTLVSVAYNDDAHLHYQTFALNSITLKQLKSYSKNKFANYDRFDDAEESLDDNPLTPFIFAEVGADFDRADIDNCSPISFHNMIWATSFMGGIGCGQNWWWDNAILKNQYESEFKPLSLLFKGVDFESNYFRPNKWRNDGGFLDFNPKEYTVETFGLCNYDKTLGFGWIHNATAYWFNTSCKNLTTVAWPTDDDSYNNIIKPSAEVNIGGGSLKAAAQYLIEEYRSAQPNPQSLSDMFYYQEYVSTNVWGDLHVDFTDQFKWNNDYAYRVSSTGHNWRTTGSEKMDPDTLLCPIDTIRVRAIYGSDYLGLNHYHWDFGNGQTSEKWHPDIFFDKPGTYNVKLTITDSTGFVNTMEQPMVVRDCYRTKSSSTTLQSQIQLWVKDKNMIIYPNPTNSDVSIIFSDNEVAVADIYIYDLLGNELLVTKNFMNSQKISISRLSKGAYVVKAITTDNVFSTNLVVQ